MKDPGGGLDTKTTAGNEVIHPQPVLTLDCHQLVKENEKFVGVILVKDLVVFHTNPRRGNQESLEDSS